MPKKLPVAINPDIVQWALQESGYPRERVARRLQVKEERVAEWEEGTRQPTLRQVQQLARFLHRPFSLFFQANLPRLPPLAGAYRRLPGVEAGKESPELRLAIRQMLNRRENAVNLMEELGEEPSELRLRASLDEAPERVGSRIRDALGIEGQVQSNWQSDSQAWHAWRSRVEQLGVLVFQYSKVEISEARGVALLQFPTPVIGINNKELPAPKSYTLFHELVHVLLASANEESPALRERRSGSDWEHVERFAESVATHVLVPEDELKRRIQRGEAKSEAWNIAAVRRLATRFRVTPLALATRLRFSGYMTARDYASWKRSWDDYVAGLKPRRGGFATPVEKAINRNGRPFVQLVLNALDGNRITAVEASRYLDLKFEHFDNLKDQLVFGARG